MRDDDIFRSLKVGTPCPMKFDDLDGDGAKRWCGECRLHVYDFAQMTRGEVTELVSTTEGRLCGRVVRRPDGTVLTKDCGPVRQRRRRLGAAAAALLATAAPFGLSACAPGADDGSVAEPPAATVPQVEPPDVFPELLGEVCVPAEEFPEELGDVIAHPGELVPARPPVGLEPRGLLGRIALPPREQQKPDDQEPDDLNDE